ncbi:alpha/beta hydrolase [candidate division WOR-3 bacterium]|nr:alpha/beta hydrolase [candidate division WOR-3 bacterium]
MLAQARRPVNRNAAPRWERRRGPGRAPPVHGARTTARRRSRRPRARTGRARVC